MTRRIITSLIKIEIPKRLAENDLVISETAKYVENAINILPFIYKAPIIILLLLLNIISLLSKGVTFDNLKENNQIKFWFFLSKFPGFRNLKRFIRVLALIRSFDFF